MKEENLLKSDNRSLITQSPQRQMRPVDYVYQFYCKQIYTQNVTFERLQEETTYLNLQKFMYFCRDFGLKDRQYLVELFKKTTLRNLDLQQFEQVLSQIATHMGMPTHEFYQQIGLGTLNDAKRKAKLVRKPFNSKDESRVDNVKYHFKLYNPSVSDQEELKHILDQRRQEKELKQLMEKDKKEVIKLKQEFKFHNPQQLVEMHPDKRHIIERIAKQSTRRYEKSLIQPESVNWEGVEKAHVDNHIIRALLEDKEDDDFLAEYKLSVNKQVQQQVQQAQPLKKRSMSEYDAVRMDKALAKQTKQQHQTNQNNAPYINVKSKFEKQSFTQNVNNEMKYSKNHKKLNISQIRNQYKDNQNDQIRKELQVLDQLIKQQKDKSQRLK
ncbi:hypothetical protein pb186bvf_008137 [Paramecium bursaria]